MMTGALAPIAILFLAFLVVQSRYLFGGRAVVRGTADLSFAEYARHGFFELVTISAMMLPILLFADWVASQHTEADRRRFRRLALSLLVLLAGLLGSALLRMSIYTSEYGLTEHRLFTTVFMGWLAFVFAWFAGDGAAGTPRAVHRWRARLGARDAVAAQCRRPRRGDRPDECLACRDRGGHSTPRISRASAPAPCRRRSLCFRPCPPANAATGPACCSSDGVTTGHPVARRLDHRTLARHRGDARAPGASRRRPRAAG